ncbi:hypothetical protein B9Z19DRAFT_1137106 [Tuber borchii]|uniref:Uncharacterized protein n=1 Tax=Tuber borchii TaxID=42251 RepID=A0A2T6ZAX0_TUBBO|nr:hypothetical protein B9Z19DRAFT_1137106 [Tuber borchii]
MAAKLDPHHLVALMSDTYMRRHDSPSSLQYGITDDQQTIIRTFPILDSIAGICVSREASQVVAVALQVDSDQQKINLTIAENENVNPKLVAHLESVWAKLQALSRLYAVGREEESNKEAKESPAKPKDTTLPLRIQIFREIYKFSLEKQMKRVDKWWRRLLDFMIKLTARREDVIQGMEEDLSQVVVGLHLVLQLVRRLHRNPAAELTEDEWELVYVESIWANQKARLVLADREEDGCEILAKELNDSSSLNETFLLRRALQKLTSLPHHIESLFEFAHSPHLLPGLQYRMSISTVPEQNNDVELPGSRQQWLSILEIAATKSLTWQMIYARVLSNKFQQKHCLCPVHPECRLAQYLATSHGNQWDHVTALSYIGISKPSCGACRIWMEAFSEVSQRKFYTRAFHGKWDWPWAMPMVEEPLTEVIAEESSHENTPNKSLSQTIARKISLEYISCLKAQNLFYPRADESFEEAESALTSAQEESIISSQTAAWQQFGSMGEYFESLLSDNRLWDRTRGQQAAVTCFYFDLAA